MKLFIKLIIVLFITISGLSAQQGSNDIFLKINDSEISTSEFTWLYEKNNSGSNISTIEEYLDIYILLKLKVEAAKREGYAQTESFKSELAGYRKQLARGYLTDQTIKEELLSKAFERSKEEINAYHILIRCPADAIPSDTIKAYEKALNIRERIRLGEPFISVARGASDDPTARDNGGNLGYFTVFQTPLTFEDAVYSMKPGNLSKPVRTAEGYHIIKVQDRRPARGKVRVAHIMKATPKGLSMAQISQARVQIDSIYSMILSGNDFSTLAKEYSDDKGSALSGGVLPWFGAGEMVHELAEESFKLLRDGDFSKPFRTIYGWHIVIRLDKQPPQSYEETRKVLESKMSQSYLESVSKKSFIEKLKDEYNFQIDQQNLEWLISIADSAFRSGTYRWSEKMIPNSNIYRYANQSVSMNEFADYISVMGQRAYSTDSIKYIKTLIDLKSYDDLYRYEDSILEEKYPEFRYLVNEFHDGILLFEISQKVLWSKVTEDSEGLREYWEKRKSEYMSEDAAFARIFTISPDAGKSRAKKLEKKIIKSVRSGKTDSVIINEILSAWKQSVSVHSENYLRGENPILERVKWSPGNYKVNDSNGTNIIFISDIKHAEPLPFEDARSFIIDDYQKNLETEWHQQLLEQNDVKIDEQILNMLIEKYRL